MRSNTETKNTLENKLSGSSNVRTNMNKDYINTTNCLFIPQINNVLVRKNNYPKILNISRIVYKPHPTFFKKFVLFLHINRGLFRNNKTLENDENKKLLH
jgi:hypothetical protein